MIDKASPHGKSHETNPILIERWRHTVWLKLRIRDNPNFSGNNKDSVSNN